ncbi:MAG: hypothetical protein HQM12_01645 [SAR324 cluster bacterium]|nr:hypothetical protein [SAR324 cluster bacterium]
MKQDLRMAPTSPVSLANDWGKHRDFEPGGFPVRSSAFRRENLNRSIRSDR